MNAKHYYWCNRCRHEYDGYLQALHCCEPSNVYRCGECNVAYRDEKSADDCCVTASPTSQPRYAAQEESECESE